jgi:hypothetical protein
MFYTRRMKFGLTLMICGVLLGFMRESAHSQSGISFTGPPAMPGASGSGAMGPGMMPPAYYSEAQLAELRLGQQAVGLLQQYSAQTDAKAKTEIKKALREVLISQFELQHQRRDEELKKIEQRLADLKSKLSKRGEVKNTIVDRRLEQLVSDVEGLGWGADDVPQDLFSSDFGSSSGPRGSSMGAGMGMPGGIGSPRNRFSPPPPAGLPLLPPGEILDQPPTKPSLGDAPETDLKSSDNPNSLDGIPTLPKEPAPPGPPELPPIPKSTF